MTEYKNLNELWQDTLANIGIWGHELESRVGTCKEIIGFQAVLTYPLHNILFVPKRKFSLSYACAEMLWYLSGTNSIEMIQAYAPQYTKFSEHGIAYGAYGARWNKNPGFVKEKEQAEERNNGLGGFEDCVDIDSIDNQLYALIHLLKTNPNTRQAIITMWDSGDLIHAILGEHKDLPCTLSLIFFVRDHKLHLVATMRSNDAWLGLPYDIFCFTTLQRIIAAELELGMGTYVHQVGSEHIYEKNQEKINLILKAPIPLYPYPLYVQETRDYDLQHNIQQALLMEEEIRKTAMYGDAYKAGEKVLVDKIEEQQNKKAWETIDPLFKDLVFGCATKWTHIPDNWFNNPLYANCQSYTELIND